LRLMLTFRRLICLLLALGLLTISAVAEMPNPTLDPNANPYDETHPELLEADQLYCTSAILIEQSTGEVIFEKNADLTMYPASTTKIMTVLLGILNSNPDDKVTVSYNGSAAAMRAIDSEATVISLQEGEELTMQDLLFGTLIRSGNDGAVAIAEAVAGNESTFVALMNQTAHDLGMNSTHFMNPHGLHDDNHYTTARDLATLARYAMQNDTFRTIAKTTEYKMAATNKQRSRTLTTRHRIMLPQYNKTDNRYYYAPMTGIKSGSTSLAGYCYVGSASLNGVDLISVVMYSSQYGVWTDTKKLMAYGFSQYQHVTISELYNLNPISIYTSAYEIDDPNQGQLTLLCQPQDATQAALAELSTTKKRIDYLSENLRDLVTVSYTRDFAAPVSAGEIMGTMTYVSDDGTPITFNLVASRSVARRSNMPLTYEEIVAMTQGQTGIPIVPETVIPVVVILLIPTIALFIIFRVHRRRKRREDFSDGIPRS
jgi:D-alanyl-D-alanine carboxypeptidase